MRKWLAKLLCSALLICQFVGATGQGSGSLQLDDFLCGMFVGGRWGTTQNNLASIPGSYFDYLRSINASWVGISVSMTVEDSMDPSVEICGPNEDFQTFSNDELRSLIRGLKENGFHVYVTLAFEHMGDGPEGKRVHRWQLGDPAIYKEDARVWREFWPWDPAHQDHEWFVREFFSSYTELAVRYAQLCQEEGVELFSLGTETDRLFHTRRIPASYWSTEFRDELSGMVQSVKAVYDGLVTYDMLSSALGQSFFGYLDYLWDDCGFDAIGISAYFQLTGPDARDGLPSEEDELLSVWRSVFREKLEPLALANPHLPVLFLEFGYTDCVESTYQIDCMQFEKRHFTDQNGNGLDDGEEQQAAAYSAMFQAVREFPGVLDGVFCHGDMVASDEDWSSSFGLLRCFSVRDKLAEEVVRSNFASLGQ